jgi:hypothetical protein
MKKPLLIFGIFLLISGCQQSANTYQVAFVERSEVFSRGGSDKNSTHPLMLVVEISDDGKLRLNRIETGTIESLTEKLRVIFDDREKAGVTQREIFIDPKGRVTEQDLERLIESLAEVKAGPIRVIKNE